MANARVLVLAGFVACNGATSASSPSGGGTSPCDPLAAPPTTLGTVLGVGEDGAGTVYVVDETTASLLNVRVFVQQGGRLVRQAVNGAGQIGSNEYLETFASPDGSGASRDLTLVVSGGQAVSMTLGAAGSGKASVEGLDAGPMTSLMLLAPSAVSGLPAIDVPGSVSYVADATSLGQAIVVTEPLDNEVGTAAFHLFYGPPSAMVERPIVSFEQALSGYPTIGFTVGASTYVMSIASLPPVDGGLFDAPGPVTLTTGDAALESFVLRLPTPTSLAGFSFTCLGM
jgi:hypothetical protein